MAHSRETEHYQLPLYDGTDIINPLTDFNNANEMIDETMYNVAQRAASAEQSAQQSATAVTQYDERVTEAEQVAEAAGIKAENTMNMIAEEFDPLKEGGYAIGDSVIYNQHLYTFINPHSGAWDAGDVVEQPIGDALNATIEQAKVDINNELNAAIAQIDSQMVRVPATQAMIAPPFDPNKENGYPKGYTVTYADKLYTFTEDHIGVWTGVDVEQRDVIEIVDSVENKVINKVMLSEEMFYSNDSTDTYKNKLADICSHIVDLFDNKPDNVVDIIVDGIDVQSVTFVCEWSAYDIKTKEAVTSNLVYGNSNGCRIETLVYRHETDPSFTIIDFTITGGSVGGSVNDLSDVSTSTNMSIAYHYLYKV